MADAYTRYRARAIGDLPRGSGLNTTDALDPGSYYRGDRIVNYAGNAGANLAGIFIYGPLAAAYAGGLTDAPAGAAGSREAAPSTVCGRSFGPTTLVATASGTAAIADLESGDIVTARDPATGEVADHTVTNVDVHTDPAIEHLRIDGETIETTPDHRFLTDHGWVEAAALYPGSKVEKLDGSTGTVEGYTIEVRPVIMWDLTVSAVHTFAVGEGQWVVHNAGPCDINVPASFEGATLQEARDAVPNSWGPGIPTTKDNGTRWFKPGTGGADGVRIMPGVPTAIDPFHQGPYVQFNLLGQKIRFALFGNPTLRGPP